MYLLRLQTFFCLCLIPVPDDSSLFDLPQAEKTPVSTDHSAGTGVSLSRLFYYKVQLYTGQILTCSGINLDLVSLLYEQRNVYVCTCLNSSRLGSTCSGISLESRLCLCNLKLYEKRWLYCKLLYGNGRDVIYVALS